MYRKYREVESSTVRGVLVVATQFAVFLVAAGGIVPMPQSACAVAETIEDTTWVYVAGDGIHLYRFDQETGALSHVSDNHDARPSFLAIHPRKRFLYGAGKSLSAFSIDPQSGRLKFLNSVPCNKHGLCHLVVDKTGGSILSAGYGAGTVIVRRIEADGRIGEQSALVQHEGSSIVESRQKAPHAHSINLDANNAFAFAADLGIDKIVIYRFDATTGGIAPAAQPSVSVEPGAGPRHFAFHPNGRFAYVINELDSTIGAYAYTASSGHLEEIETKTTLPDDFSEKNHTAEVVVHPSGQYLYGSNRGHNSIVVFAIDPASGRLTYVEHTSTGGNWPRNFCIDPTGKFLLAANRRSNDIRVFRIDEQTGRLKPTSHFVEVPGPNCIRFLQPKAP